MVPTAKVVPELAKVFTYFKDAKQGDESFGDFCDRKGKDDVLAWTEANA